MNRLTPFLRPAVLRRSSPRARRRYAVDTKLPSQQQPSFYKTFSRPIFKVALMAIFTYQLAYYGWTRLESDEIRADAAATISDLEKRIEGLEQAKGKK